MVAEVRSHQDAGRPAFIVSAASNGVVELLARVLDMEGGIGTRYEVDADGRYTGRLIGGLNYGELKIEPMRRFAADHGIDLDRSWAYSDSASDLPMLELVGHPVVVNPDAALARVARRARLAGHALREARPEDRRGRRPRDRDPGRRRERHRPPPCNPAADDAPAPLNAAPRLGHSRLQ